MAGELSAECEMNSTKRKNWKGKLLFYIILFFLYMSYRLTLFQHFSNTGIIAVALVLSFPIWAILTSRDMESGDLPERYLRVENGSGREFSRFSEQKLASRFS